MILPVFISVSPAQAQKSANKPDKKYLLKGIVTDINSVPVAGAFIFTDSTLTKVTTDGTGAFRIRLNSLVKMLYIGSPGAGYAQVDPRGQAFVNIVLNNDNDVPAFVKSPKLTAVKQHRENRVNTYNDIFQMIRQEVPGVLVSGKNIVVQGPNSFLGSTTPLFLVNGVRVPSIDDINPVEVKSIKLLKGSNANIYGVEGANGVISITLKTGADR